ncbi:hypothetical protein HPB52_010353 [Rhipicephalus sanguineus]|uniref:Uncharacterized protein n=1 Tax=Rhipicephalus sanguineus TaxID=34632 RepID=A0A9D4PR95_RHISA|nr:hypothetical protein HPB52_010353 [Rhipicephalus sanguineus]
MGEDLRARVNELEANLRQAAEIGNVLITKNTHLEKELEETRERYFAKVEKDSASSDQALMADNEKLQKQIRRLEEQLCESRQMNERLLMHNTSASASSPRPWSPRESCSSKKFN